MGLFDKLKAAAKFVTGGGAKVRLEVVDPAMDKPFIVKIHATVSDAEMKIERVYLHVRATESVSVPAPRKDAAPGTAADSTSSPDKITADVQTFQQEINVSGAAQLAANGEYDWEASVSLPTAVSPTYLGKNAFHRWYFLAGLDARGNDPDSGWVEAILK
jgi:hypothetical protein